MRFLDRDGQEQELEVAGLTAGTFQHEVDHLDGVLFVDRADAVSSWEDADFEERARAIVERYGS